MTKGAYSVKINFSHGKFVLAAQSLRLVSKNGEYYE